MSRTFKDKRINKIKNGFKKEPELKLHYVNYKKKGFTEKYNNTTCPDCRSNCDYEQGYLVCNSCGWSDLLMNYSNSNELDFSEAS